MPAPAPPFSTPAGVSAQQPAATALPYPALYLYPLNDSFVPKHIALSHGQHVKIGRQTNAKTAPGERNGYFDSKVLSRQHAEVWEEGGKIYIKDVKSSNGTFINGERLSSEAVESDPYELKSDDIVEFGIDIVGEDNKTIIHHKVAARVICVFTEQDAQVAARAEQHQQHQAQQHQQAYAAPQQQQAPTGFNFAGQAGNVQNRRPPMQQPNLGGLGGGMRQPGKTGLSFDVILSRLQGELQKSRETGAELNTLTGAMSEIHDTLAGGLPTNLPPYPSVLPPVRPAQEVSPPPPATSPPDQPPPPAETAVIVELQGQLRDTQSNLSSQVDKIRALEAVLAEQEAMKREVKTLREMIESRQRELEEPKGGFEDDDDDARSVSTVVPHELESVEEEDESEEVDLEKETEDRDRREAEAEEAAREELERRNETDPGRPHTPEPLATPSSSSNLRAPSPLSQSTTVVATEEIQEQIVQLTAQVSAVVALTSTLEAQHTAAQSTISALEKKVEQLESLLRASVAPAPAPVPEPTPVVLEKEEEGVKEEAEEERGESKESLSERITEWMKNVEVKWNNVQEEWNLERERLGRAREEWERRVASLGQGQQGTGSGFSNIGGYGRVGNGDVVKHNGLVTPPSPRSQSSDSGRYRRRVRRRNNAAAAKKEESASASGGESGDTDEEEGAERSVGSTSLATSASSSFGVSTGASALANATADTAEDLKEKVMLATPEASVYQDKLTTLSKGVVENDAEVVKEESHEDVSGKAVSDRERNMIHVQTAVGVLLLSVAAAAVIWKVKPE
ncbi:hypothetical protein DFP72DRAFT_1152264 [Ephemerocybe angulata]|uniref:FHA domain-containing protein n=1 Tax=Ephemerocybe angulata TaxID=980116 RepID=A0A8H6HHQ6_9AGAR|nr:hypothetical protein DFP72DRAFT_1152264 [Tulosesus angulatus]